MVARMKSAEHSFTRLILPPNQPLIFSVRPASNPVRIREGSQLVAPDFDFLSFESLAEKQMVSLADDNGGTSLAETEFQKRTIPVNYLKKRSLRNSVVQQVVQVIFKLRENFFWRSTLQGGLLQQCRENGKFLPS